MTRKIRILVIATNDWCAIGQFLSALIHVGFEIAVVHPSGSPIQHVKNLSARYKYRSWRSQKSIRTAIAEWSPDLLLCNDDIAVRDLHDLHREVCTETGGPETSRLLHLIELSFGRFSVVYHVSIEEPPHIACSSSQDCLSTYQRGEHISRDRTAPRPTDLPGVG